MKHITSALEYLKARLTERSTWGGIIGFVTGAAALSPPFSYVVCALGVVAMLVPEPGNSDDA